LLFQISHFSTQQWVVDNNEILKMIISRFSDGCIVIRSSACDEDGAQKARAGEYESVLDVPVGNPAQIRTAIDRVVASYQRNGPRVGVDTV
jgi:hypothetical protein